MVSDIQTAITLLFVGMLAVFSILALVVLSGRGLIMVVNRYFPEKETEPIEIPRSVFRPKQPDHKKLAAITAAVEHITNGRARITRIEKQDK